MTDIFVKNLTCRAERVKEHAIQTDLVGDVDFASVEIIDTLDYRS